jgi:5'-phosphate synthase pdxT subunit
VSDSADTPADPGDMLRRVRRLARLSQRDLADLAGIPLTTIARIESGAVANPGLRTMDELVRAAGFALDVTVDRGSEPPAVIATHPFDAVRDLSGRRIPAHLEVLPVGTYAGLSDPYRWWGWAYQWSSDPRARVPSATYTLRRGRYWRPSLDPTTGAATEQETILDARQSQTDLSHQLQCIQPRYLARRAELQRRRGSTMTRIGVFALQGDVREHVRALQSAGCEAVAVRRPAELAEVDGLVLPGGESTTMIKLAGIFDLLVPLRRRIAEGMPVYGSCAGMILLADRLDSEGSPLAETIGGLDITVRRNAFGRQVDSFEEDVAIRGIDGDPVRAVFIRAPWVQQVGPKATALGTTEAGHVVAVRQGPLLATSFHPEMTGDGRVHAYFCAMVAGTEGLAG